MGIKAACANGICSGDAVVYLIDQRKGIVRDIFQDGDACVEFNDGFSSMVKWNHLQLCDSPSDKSRMVSPQRQAVKVIAVDFDGMSFDGLPFSDVPRWLETALKERRIVLTPTHKSYAAWTVTTKDGNYLAEPDDWIVFNENNHVHPLHVISGKIADILKSTWIIER